MQRFLKWYKQSRKNKVIVFSIIFIVALLYSFLHRPLGLMIFWISTHYGDSYNEMQRLDKIHSNIINKDIFIQLSDEYNLSTKVAKHRKEFLNYTDKFTTDILVANSLGLEEWYYQPLLIKAKIYALEEGYYALYKAHKGTPITQDDIQSILYFFKSFDTLIFFFNEISLQDAAYKRYMLQANMIQFMFIMPQISLLADLENTLCLVIDTKARNELLQRMSDINDSLSQYFGELEIYFDKNTAIDTINKAKDKLNECE